MMAATHKTFLLFLADCVPNQAKLLLGKLSSSQYLAIKEVCTNLLRGSIKVSALQLVQHKKYKQFYRQLALQKKVKLLQKPIILLLQAAKQTIEIL